VLVNNQIDDISYQKNIKKEIGIIALKFRL
jgi:hypothetical protein